MFCCFTSTVSSWGHVGTVRYLTALLLGNSPICSLLVSSAHYFVWPVTENLLFLNQPKREKSTKDGRGVLYLDCLHTCYQPRYRACGLGSKNVGEGGGDGRYAYMFRYLV